MVLPDAGIPTTAIRAASLGASFGGTFLPGPLRGLWCGFAASGATLGVAGTVFAAAGAAFGVAGTSFVVVVTIFVTVVVALAGGAVVFVDFVVEAVFVVGCADGISSLPQRISAKQSSMKSSAFSTTGSPEVLSSRVSCNNPKICSTASSCLCAASPCSLSWDKRVS